MAANAPPGTAWTATVAAKSATANASHARILQGHVRQPRGRAPPAPGPAQGPVTPSLAMAPTLPVCSRLGPPVRASAAVIGARSCLRPAMAREPAAPGRRPAAARRSSAAPAPVNVRTGCRTPTLVPKMPSVPAPSAVATFAWTRAATGRTAELAATPAAPTNSAAVAIARASTPCLRLVVVFAAPGISSRGCLRWKAGRETSRQFGRSGKWQTSP